MKTHTLARLAVLALLLHTAPQAFGFGAGANNFANATDISDGSLFSGSTNLTAYTVEANEPGHRNGGGTGAGRSAWWTYTAPESGFLTIDTLRGRVGTNPVFDTLLGVYTGAALNALTRVAHSDDWGSTPYNGTTVTSRVTFYALAGTTYHIAVDAYQASEITATAFNVVLSLRLLPLRKQTRNAYINIENNPDYCGGLTYTTTGTGAFSGKLSLGSKVFPLAGIFGVDGYATISLVRPVAKGATPLPPITLILDGCLGGQTFIYIPEVNEFDFDTPEKAVFNPVTDNFLDGYYTGGFVMDGSGRGIITCTLKPTGALTGSFLLPDGVSVPFSTVINTITPGVEYRAYIFKSLSVGKGFLTASIRFTEAGDLDTLSGHVDYIRPSPKPGVIFYVGGYGGTALINGKTYPKPTAGQRVLGFLNGSNGNGTLILADENGELGGDVNEVLNLTTSNKFSFTSASRKPVLTLNPATGLVTGSIIAPPLKKRTLKGVIYRNGGTILLEGYVTGSAKNLYMRVDP